MEIMGTLLLLQEPQSLLCLPSDDVSASGAQEVGEVPGPPCASEFICLVVLHVGSGQYSLDESPRENDGQLGPLGKDTSD